MNKEEKINQIIKDLVKTQREKRDSLENVKVNYLIFLTSCKQEAMISKRLKKLL